MKTDKRIIRGIAFAGIIATTSLNANAGQTEPAPSALSSIVWTAAGKPSSEKQVDVLFVQNAENCSLQGNKLTLKSINASTICFTDRPNRMAGHMPTTKFVPLWSEGKDSFLNNNPNGTLSVLTGEEVTSLVIELSNPQLSGTDLSYEVKVLEGTFPAAGGSCSLFIDIIGMPRTPRSYAGAARRFYR
jgi:hypothetical protein